MLKRKLYVLAIGAVVAHLSTAQVWNSGALNSFGDGFASGVASFSSMSSETAPLLPMPVSPVPLPMQVDFASYLNPFINGNTAFAAPDLPNIPRYLAEQKKIEQEWVEKNFAQKAKPLNSNEQDYYSISPIWGQSQVLNPSAAR